jgi:hypothetical protein
MDFLDPKKRRAHKWQLFIGYGLMMVLIGLASTIILLLSYGYGWDRQNREIIQNGLVFVDSRPVPPDVFLNGESKGRGRQRLVLPAGNYDLELQREGYRTWQRSFQLDGGKIERFVYPVLLPEVLVNTPLGQFEASPPLSSVSPDRRWLVIQQPGSLSTFRYYDVSVERPVPVIFTLPDDLLTITTSPGSLELIEWSTNNVHLLMHHKSAELSEFILVNRENPAESVNLSRHFAPFPFDSISLLDKRYNRYYLHDAASSTLSTAELENRSVSPLMSGVLSYASHGNDILLFTTHQDPDVLDKGVFVKMSEGNDERIIRELPVGDTYHLDVARFDGRWYAVVGSRAEKRVYVYRNPMTQFRDNPTLRPAPISVLRLQNSELQAVSFSATARVIAMQGGSEFAVYDAETDNTYRYDTELDLRDGAKAKWMDGHRMTLVNKAGEISIFDFDGANMQTFGNCLGSHTPLFNRDYTAMFCIVAARNEENPAAAVLRRTEMLVRNN